MKIFWVPIFFSDGLFPEDIIGAKMALNYWLIFPTMDICGRLSCNYPHNERRQRAACYAALAEAAYRSLRFEPPSNELSGPGTTV